MLSKAGCCLNSSSPHCWRPQVELESYLQRLVLMFFLTHRRGLKRIAHHALELLTVDEMKTKGDLAQKHRTSSVLMGRFTCQSSVLVVFLSQLSLREEVVTGTPVFKH